MFEFIEVDGNDFFFKLGSIHFHLEGDGSFGADGELLVKFGEGIEDIFGRFEEERKLTMLLNVWMIDVEMVVLGRMLAFNLEDEDASGLSMLEVKLDIKGPLLCGEATLALLQLVADHFDSNIYKDQRSIVLNIKPIPLGDKGLNNLPGILAFWDGNEKGGFI